MAETLILLLGLAPAAPIRWGRFAGARLIEGGRLDSAAALHDLPDAASAAERVVALLPGEVVAARRAPSFPKGAAKARAAGAYLMEDELAEPADALHVAVAEKESASLAIAVKSAIVGEWLAAFALAGIDCDLLSADYLALPSSADEATLLFDGERVIAAINGVGFALELDLFFEIAPELLNPAPMRITAIGDSALQRHLPSASAIDWSGVADDARILATFGAAVAASAPPNLLQGSYQKQRALRPLIAPWRRAGLIAAAAAGVFCVGLVAEALGVESDASAWRRAASDLHQERFPDAASSEPVEHARQILAQAGGDNAFLALAARFATALQNNQDVEIERMRFNATQGEFIVSVRSASDTGIETLKTALAAAGVAAEDSGGYRRSGGEWTGELAARLK